MIVIIRFRVPTAEALEFGDLARSALEALAGRPGYLSGKIGRAADDPELGTLLSEWSGAGTYRRALSAYEVRIATMPLMSYAHDEPSAYEVVHAVGGSADHKNRA